jgi:hypothetical protein
LTDLLRLPFRQYLVRTLLRSGILFHKPVSFLHLI